LGIKPYNWWSEALHGVARNGLATVYPITMGMASVFDDKLIEDIYVTVSDEGRAKFHDARRHGRYGRGNEAQTLHAGRLVLHQRDFLFQRQPLQQIVRTLLRRQSNSGKQ